MEISKSDWQLFRAKLPEWQEAYMEKLLIEYAAILNEEKLASEKFWELEARIKEDKRKPGVIIDMHRSKMVNNILVLLNDGVITFDDLSDFSEQLKDSINFLIDLLGQ